MGFFQARTAFFDKKRRTRAESVSRFSFREKSQAFFSCLTGAALAPTFFALTFFAALAAPFLPGLAGAAFFFAAFFGAGTR